MKHLCISGILLVASLFLFIACTESISSEAESISAETVAKQAPGKSVFDPAKGCQAMAPEMSKILGDTLDIVMYEFTMKPGDSVGWHEHPFHTIYVLEGGTLAVYFEGAEKQIMELSKGIGFISPPMSDAAVNIGNTTIKLLTHDIYRPRRK